MRCHFRGIDPELWRVVGEDLFYEDPRKILPLKTNGISIWTLKPKTFSATASPEKNSTILVNWKLLRKFRIFYPMSMKVFTLCVQPGWMFSATSSTPLGEKARKVFKTPTRYLSLSPVS